MQQEILKKVLEECLALGKEETLLIVADETKTHMAQMLLAAGKEMAAEAILMVMQERAVSGEEPPAAVAAAMECADVVICITEKSLTHTNARINAVKKGARIATMPGITERMFSEGAITADYRQVKERTMRLAEMLTKANTARIEKEGHTLTMTLAGRKGVASTGIYDQPGMGGNLPSGEAYISPLEGEAFGTMVIDGSMVGIGRLDQPLTVTIEKGRLRDIQGQDREKVTFLCEDEKRSVLAELGIGTNDKAILCGKILEDEKVYGTVHIAFGTNTSFGGVNKADCHVDGVIIAPDLYLDDTLVMERGNLVI